MLSTVRATGRIGDGATERQGYLYIFLKTAECCSRHFRTPLEVAFTVVFEERPRFRSTAASGSGSAFGTI